MELNPDLADSIVKSTCVLCNYLRHEVVGQADQGDSFDLDGSMTVCAVYLDCSHTVLDLICD